MTLTRYEKGYLSRLIKEIKGQNAGEIRSLLKLLDELDTDLGDGETLEVEDSLVKKCWSIAQRFGPTFETSERGLELAEKLESL